MPINASRESLTHGKQSSENGTNVDLEAQGDSLAIRRGQAPPRVSINDKKLSVDPPLLPSRNPPQYSVFDVFPFSLLVRFLTKRGKEVKGKKGAKERMKRRVVSHNIPLEITLYLVSLMVLYVWSATDSSGLELVYIMPPAAQARRCPNYQ